jgi:hypothetical protein
VSSLAETSRARTVVRVACLALIAVALVRLALVVPRWLAGAPPAYPDEYVEPLRSALVEIPILSVAILERGGAQPPWRRVLPWALLAVSVAAMGLGGGRS